MGNLVKETPYSEVTATLETLDRFGIEREHLARLRSDADCAKRVAECIRGGSESSADLRIVRAIMGERIFGPEDWAALYNARLPKKIPAFPWSEDVLNAPCPFHRDKTVAETHFAFLGLAKLNGKSLTIMRWRELHPNSGQPRLYLNDPWYGRKTFATATTCEFRWYLMPLEIVPNSEYKNYQEQLTALPEDYEVPTAIAEVTKDILAFRKTGTYVNPKRYGRCLDVSSDGFRVDVGRFDRDGLCINDCWPGRRHGYIRLAAARKS
jgi:hypothetical protein